MRKTNVNYPHPLLNGANEDYINSSFDIVLSQEPSIEGDIATIVVEYDLDCAGLKQLLLKEFAKVVVYLESVEAGYRKIEIFDIDKTKKTISINKNFLNNMVQIRGYITAAKDIFPFKLNEHNKDLFGDVPFKIRKGDILAISNNFFNIPLRNYDPLVDKPSIFSIRRQIDRPNEEIRVDFLENEKITIFLNNETYKKYETLKDDKKMRTLLATFFAVPVLVDVLCYLKNATDDELETISQKKWYQVINSKMLAFDISLNEETSMSRVANIILPHIFATYIDDLTGAFEEQLGISGGENI